MTNQIDQPFVNCLAEETKVKFLITKSIIGFTPHGEFKYIGIALCITNHL